MRDFISPHVYVQLSFKFILGLSFVFLLFLGMVLCDNEFETMENAI